MSWLLALVVAAHAAATWPTVATVASADGVKLQVSWAAPAKADRAVVFVHGAGRSGADWQSTAEKAFRAGLIVAVVDLRGHGASVVGTPAELTPNDYAAMIGDVHAALAHVRAQGAKKVSLIGADLGGNLVLNVAADDADVSSVVLLSPGMDYKGIVTTDAIRRYGARPILFVASRDDKYGASSATALDANAVGPHQLQMYEAAGKGARMLNKEAGLESTILGFVGGAWDAVAGAKPATPSVVNISVESGTVKASAPPVAPSVPGTTPPK